MNKYPQVLLIGNGINRAYGGDSWTGILKRISKRIGFTKQQEPEKIEKKEETPGSLLNIPQPVISQPVSIETDNTQGAVNKIRGIVRELEQAGVKISLDEMNFERSRQIIIKIEK